MFYMGFPWDFDGTSMDGVFEKKRFELTVYIRKTNGSKNVEGEALRD